MPNHAMRENAIEREMRIASYSTKGKIGYQGSRKSGLFSDVSFLLTSFFLLL
jgi:hypothetical protein